MIRIFRQDSESKIDAEFRRTHDRICGPEVDMTIGTASDGLIDIGYYDVKIGLDNFEYSSIFHSLNQDGRNCLSRLAKGFL